MRTIAEDLLLFVLDDAKGTVGWQSSQPLPFALAGALLAELALRGRVRLDAKQLVVTDPTPTGDDLLDEALVAIGASKKPRTAKHWVSALTRAVKRTRERLADRLVAAGIVRRQEHRVLFFFEQDRFPTADPLPELRMRDEVRAVLLGTAQPDARMAVLVALLRTANVLDRLVDKPDRKRARARATAILESDAIGTAASDAARAAAAAASAATTAAVVAASVASSSSG